MTFPLILPVNSHSSQHRDLGTFVHTNVPLTPTHKSSRCIISTGFAMSSPALLLFFLPLSAYSQDCGPFTDSDFEGPYFVADADLEYSTAPGDELADREQAAYLTGQVSFLMKRSIGRMCYHGSIQAQEVF